MRMTNHPLRRLRAGVLGLVGIAAAFPLGSLAQVDEIIVTARKREENLQEVPLSITSFAAESLRERNIQSIYDVANFTPNFSFQRSIVGRRLDAPAIRGQFTPSQNFGIEGNVAFFVDGVYVSGSAGSLTIDNIERVEILRGPQAALFGRAAFAGAVNYITRQATDEFEGQVNLKAGEERDFKTAAWVSGPIVEERLRYMVSASYESFDGEWNNELTPCQSGETPEADGCDRVVRSVFWGPASTRQPSSAFQDDFTELGGESAKNVTAKLSWQALESLEVIGKAEYTKTDDEHFASLFHPQLNCYIPGNPDDPRAGQTSPTSTGWFCGELRIDGLSAAMNIAELKTGATSIYSTAAPAPFIGQETVTKRYLLEGILELGGWTLTARGTKNEQELESYRDLDRAPGLGPTFLNLFTAGENQFWDDKSFEFRATSDPAQRFRGTFGAYYFNQDQLSYQREYTGFCNRVEYGLPLINGQRSWNLNAEKENRAVFGGAEFDITDSLKLSAETRYAKDTPTQRASNGVVATTDYYSFTPRVTLSYQATDDVNLYALWAKGNKPGGFFYGYFDAPVVRRTGIAATPGTEEALESGDAVIKEEEAITYEFGAKTQWLDRRLTANVSVYYIDWTNQAINEVANILWDCADTGVSNTVANNFIRNAGESQVTGAEVELSFAVTDFLRLTLNYGLANTELEEFNSLVKASLSGDGDAAGNQAPNVPKHTLSGSAAYQRPFGDRGAEWFARADYVYNSKRYLDAENEVFVGDYTLVNARIGIRNDDWTASLYVDNLLDEDTPLLATAFPDFGNFPNVVNAFHLVPRRSRHAGIQLQYRFGGD